MKCRDLYTPKLEEWAKGLKLPVIHHRDGAFTMLAKPGDKRLKLVMDTAEARKRCVERHHDGRGTIWPGVNDWKRGVVLEYGSQSPVGSNGKYNAVNGR